MQRSGRSSILLASGAAAAVAAVALVAAFALPVAGQDPTASPGATDKPGQGPPAAKPGNGPKPGKGPMAGTAARLPEVAVSLTGRVGVRTDADGDSAYTLTVGGTVYELHVGPPWWWGENHPLQGLVGDTVTITGEGAEGSVDVDVFTVDGKAVREPGRPPWAGGWKMVGERHPGWAQWKVDKIATKAQGKGLGPPPWAGPKSPAPDAD